MVFFCGWQYVAILIHNTVQAVIRNYSRDQNGLLSWCRWLVNGNVLQWEILYASLTLQYLSNSIPSVIFPNDKITVYCVYWTIKENSGYAITFPRDTDHIKSIPDYPIFVTVIGDCTPCLWQKLMLKFRSHRVLDDDLHWHWTWQADQCFQCVCRQGGGGVGMEALWTFALGSRKPCIDVLQVFSLFVAFSHPCETCRAFFFSGHAPGEEKLDDMLDHQTLPAGPSFFSDLSQKAQEFLRGKEREDTAWYFCS